jgi:hypothetical protein
MKTQTFLQSGLCWLSLLALPGISSGQTPDPFGDLQSKYQVASAEIQMASAAEIQRLSDAYVQALTRLEGDFQSAGKLDLLLKARNEREQFLKSGKPGEDATPELANLRAILDQNRKPLEEKMAAAVADLSQKYLNQLEVLQVELTKTGQIDMAVKVKEAAEKVRAGLAQSDSVPTTPVAAAPPLPVGKKVVDVPVITPQPVSEDPFRSGNWPVTLAIPQGNYRFEGSHSIKGEKGRQLLLMPGSQFQGSDSSRWVVGNSLVVAKDVTFRKFQFQGDLGSVLHFENCRFEDMIIGKGGPWFGGPFMSRWQMRDCTVSGSFIDRWVIKNVGVQIIGGQFERVEFPPIEYESDQEPSEVASQDWATFSGVRFRKCVLPASVLSLTDNCEFDDCRFIDDPKPVEFKSPITRTLFVSDCTDNLKNVSKNLKLEKKPIPDRPAPLN